MRIRKLYAGLTREALDGIIVSSPANIFYLTGYPGRDSYLLVSKKGNIYFTDSRYTEEARRGLKGRAALKKINGSVFGMIAGSCRDLGLKRVGFEENRLSVAQYNKIKQESGNKPGLFPAAGLIEALREIKSAEELERTRGAVRITGEAFRFIEGFISSGVKESEVAAELERFIRYKGASAAAFDIIVASGPNSSEPHHLTSQRRLKNNEPVLIDMGVEYMGYKSDLTRVFFLGKITPAVAKIYDIVKSANRNAISRIKPAVQKNRIDAAARQYITRKGYGGFFGHSTGHGVGLEAHEEPRISPKAAGALKQGMVFTVEPGIYLPAEFGIRIEDMVLVTGKGCEVLSGAINK